MIVQIAIGALLLWVILKFYWLRVIACTLLLIVWGAFAIIAPLGLAFSSFAQGNLFVGGMQIAIVGFMGAFWSIGARAAHSWVRQQQKYELFWQPWNAR